MVAFKLCKILKKSPLQSLLAIDPHLNDVSREIHSSCNPNKGWEGTLSKILSEVTAS